MNAPTLGLSLLAGLLSFLSPCVLPLLPSYLSFVGGVTLTELKDDRAIRRALLINTVFFVVGFSVVFVTLGVVFAGSALFAPGAARVINVVAGGIVIVLGLNIIFDFISILNFERKVHVTRRPKGKIGSFLVGLAFAAGWTPCIGPILTGILLLAGRSGTVGTGVLYLSVYSLGLAIPFLLTAAFFSRATGLFSRLRRHFRLIRIVSGGLLILIGLLIAVGRFQNLNIVLFQAATAVGRWTEGNPLAARIVPAVVLLLLATPFFVRVGRSRKKSKEHDSSEGTAMGSAIAGIVLALLATLQLAGVLSIMSIVSVWLRFQGI